jgi:hypothetical protein
MIKIKVASYHLTSCPRTEIKVDIETIQLRSEIEPAGKMAVPQTLECMTVCECSQADISHK